MYRPIPVEEVDAALPKSQQDAIAKRGAELVARVNRRMAQALCAEERDACFRAKVQQALDDQRPGIPHEQAKAHFQKTACDSIVEKGEIVHSHISKARCGAPGRKPPVLRNSRDISPLFREVETGVSDLIIFFC